MTSLNQTKSILAGSIFLIAAPAWAGNSGTPVTAPIISDSCKTENGSLCKPTGVTEEVVPEYYNVPTKTRHIYYKKPQVEPIVTHIIHHVPTPVYGGETVVEKVQAGHWQGAPVVSCCQQQAPQPVRPTYVAPQRPVYVAPPRPVVRTHAPCQARHQPHVQPRPCR